MLDRHNVIFFFSTKAQKTETVYYYLMGFPGGWVIKNLRAMQETHICSYEWGSEWKSLSDVWLFVTPWTVALQAPLSMEFSRQEYWSELLFPSPICSYAT